jgi:SnoaL-like domain
MATYFDCWRKGDLATLRTILADDFSFRGPLGQVDNADDGVKAMQGLVRMTTDIVVRKVCADRPDVLTWFELHTTAGPPCPVANWAMSTTARSTGSGRRPTRGRFSAGRRTGLGG